MPARFVRVAEKDRRSVEIEIDAVRHGLFYAFGFCGTGFQVGPAVGDVMAEFIDTGRTCLSLDAFRIGHFAQQKAA